MNDSSNIDYTKEMIGESPIYEEPAKLTIQPQVTPIIPFKEFTKQDAMNDVHFGLVDYANLFWQKFKTIFKIAGSIPATINYINVLKEFKMPTTGVELSAEANQLLKYLEMLAPIFKKPIPDDMQVILAKALTSTGQAIDDDIAAEQAIAAWIKTI